MMTAKGIFSPTGRASFSKLRGAFFKIPKADFRKFSIDSMCVVTSATMSHDNMLQWVIRGQVNGHRTGLGRPDPGHSGAPKGPPKPAKDVASPTDDPTVSPAATPVAPAPRTRASPTFPCFKAWKFAIHSCVAIRPTNNSRALNSFPVPSASAIPSSAS